MRRNLVLVACIFACAAWLVLAPPADARGHARPFRHVHTATCDVLEEATRSLPPPIAPGEEAWYDRLDDPATRDVNEAAWDIALAIDPSGGALFGHSYHWLVEGGRMVIIVGGTNCEDSVGGWELPAQEWVRQVAREDFGCAVVPVLQINYRLPGVGPVDPNQVNLLAYPFSYALGLRRAEKMIRKAISAGSRDVWILGHSKGADIVGNAVARTARLPELTHGFSFAPPYLEVGAFGIRSLVAPSANRFYRRSGLLKYDRHNGARFDGKLIVFNKYSDKVANNLDPLQFWHLIDYGHDYVRVLGDPRFRARLRALVDSPVRHYEDRPAGIRFDE